MKNLFIVHTDCLPDPVKISDFSFNQWVYFGRNYLKLVTCEKRLDDYLKRISIGEMIEETAWNLRTKYIEWIADLGKPFGSSLKWQLTRIGDKNTLVSSLFLNLCQLEILVSLFKKYDSLLVVVEDWELFGTILHGFSNRNRKVQTTIQNRIGYINFKCRRPIRVGAIWGLFFSKCLINRYSIKRSRQNTANAGKAILPQQPIAIIHTCVDDSCLEKNGIFKDRFFPGLAEWLKSKGYRVLVIPFPYQTNIKTSQLYRWFRESSTDFLIPDDYTTFRDYFCSFLKVLKTVFIPKRVMPFKGLNIKQLVNHLRWQQAENSEQVRFLNYIPLIKKMVGSGLKVDLFVDKFENMPKEKPQIQALKKYMPKCKIIGYQHSSIAPFMLKYSVGKGEFDDGLFPDFIISNGDWFKKCLIMNGFPESKVRSGPSLRSNYLFSLQQVISENNSACEKQILVVLSLDLSMSIELIDKVNASFKNTPYRIILKPHPMADKGKLSAYFGSEVLSKNVYWFEGEMDEALKTADCVISIGSASVMEAAASGVPVVIVGRECGLDLNPLAWWKDEYPEFRSVYTHTDLKKSVEERLDGTNKNRKNRSIEIREKVIACYSQKSEETMNAFLS